MQWVLVIPLKKEK